MPATRQDVEDFYNHRVEPLYSEFISRTGERLKEIDAKLVTATTQLMKGNFDAALRHFSEAGILTAQDQLSAFAEKAAALVEDADKRRWCVQAPQNQEDGKFRQATACHAQAREAAQAAGTTAELIDALGQYEKALEAYEGWMNLFDPARLKDYKTFTRKAGWKNHGIGFVLGALASAIVAVATLAFTPSTAVPSPGGTTSPQQAAPGKAG